MTCCSLDLRWIQGVDILMKPSSSQRLHQAILQLLLLDITLAGIRLVAAQPVVEYEKNFLKNNLTSVGSWTQIAPRNFSYLAAQAEGTCSPFQLTKKLCYTLESWSVNQWLDAASRVGGVYTFTDVFFRCCDVAKAVPGQAVKPMGTVTFTCTTLVPDPTPLGTPLTVQDRPNGINAKVHCTTYAEFTSLMIKGVKNATTDPWKTTTLTGSGVNDMRAPIGTPGFGIGSGFGTGAFLNAVVTAEHYVPRNPAANDLAITSILRLSKFVKAPLPLTDVPGVVLIPQL